MRNLNQSLRAKENLFISFLVPHDMLSLCKKNHQNQYSASVQATVTSISISEISDCLGRCLYLPSVPMRTLLSSSY